MNHPAMERFLKRLVAGPVATNVHDYAAIKLKHRGLVEVVDYRPGRLRQTFAITQRGRDELARRSVDRAPACGCS